MSRSEPHTNLGCKLTLIILLVLVSSAAAIAQSMDDINRGIRERAAAEQRRQKEQEKQQVEQPNGKPLNKWQHMVEEYEGIQRTLSSIEARLSRIDVEQLAYGNQDLDGVYGSGARRSLAQTEEKMRLLQTKLDLSLHAARIKRDLTIHAGDVDAYIKKCSGKPYAPGCE